jgi:hypothetical protein
VHGGQRKCDTPSGAAAAGLIESSDTVLWYRSTARGKSRRQLSDPLTVRELCHVVTYLPIFTRNFLGFSILHSREYRFESSDFREEIIYQ